MSATSQDERCEHAEQACAHALQAQPAAEVPALEAHLATCPRCRSEVQALRPVVAALAAWPTDVLRPAAGLQGRLAARIAADHGGVAAPPPPPSWSEPEWEEVAPGIFCKLLANDTIGILASGTWERRSL